MKIRTKTIGADINNKEGDNGEYMIDFRAGEEKTENKVS